MSTSISSRGKPRKANSHGDYSNSVVPPQPPPPPPVPPGPAPAANGAQPLSFVTPIIADMGTTGAPPPMQAVPGNAFRPANPSIHVTHGQLINHGGSNFSLVAAQPQHRQPPQPRFTNSNPYPGVAQFAPNQFQAAAAHYAAATGAPPQQLFYMNMPGVQYPVAAPFFQQQFVPNPASAPYQPQMPQGGMAMGAQQQYISNHQGYMMQQQPTMPPVPPTSTDYGMAAMGGMPPAGPPVMPPSQPVSKKPSKMLKIVDPNTSEVTNLREIEEQAAAAAEAEAADAAAIASTSGRLSAPPPTESRSESRQSSVAQEFTRQKLDADLSGGMPVEDRQPSTRISPSPPVQLAINGEETSDGSLPRYGINAQGDHLESSQGKEGVNGETRVLDEAGRDVSEERATPQPDEPQDDFSLRSEGEEDAGEEEDERVDDARRKEMLELADRLIDAESLLHDGVYPREFLYLCFDKVKLMRKPECPLADDTLKELQLDRSTQPSQLGGIDRSRRMDPVGGGGRNFNTSWMSQGGGLQPAPPRLPTRPQYGGRQSDRPGGRHRRPPGPPMPRPSIERAPRPIEPLHRAENAWRPDRDTNLEDEEEVAARKLYKEIRGLLNKITPSTFDDLCTEFLQLQVYKMKDRMSNIIDIIFDKAVEEPKFCPLYSDLCSRQVQDELAQGGGRASNFRNGILTRCQKTFEDKRQEEILKKREEAAAETDEKNRAVLLAEIADLQQKDRRRMFGNIGFIGQLYRNGLIVPKILNWCIVHLLKGHNEAENGDEESVECAVKILETVGKVWDKERTLPSTTTTPSVPEHPRRGAGGRGGGQVQQQMTTSTTAEGDLMHPSVFYKHLEELSDKVSNRVRFLIINLIELRNNNWEPRKTADSGPKTIEQVHKEAQKEQLENKVARDQYDQRGRATGRPGDYASTGTRGTRAGPGGSGQMRPQATVVGRGSVDNRPTAVHGPRTVQQQSDKRSQAAYAANTIQPTASRKQLDLRKVVDGPLGGQKKVWSSGSGGGGQNPSDARRAMMSTGGVVNAASASQENSQPSSREPSESRKQSLADDRVQALKAVTAMTSSSDTPRLPVCTPTPSTMDPVVGGEDEDGDSDDSCARGRENGSESPDSIATQPSADLDRVIVNGLKTEVLEYSTDVVKISDIYETMRERVAKVGGGARRVFRLLMQLGVDAFPGPSGEQRRKHIGQILCRCLQDPAIRGDALKGVADFAAWVVAEELWQDLQRVWEDFAEILVAAILCELDHFPGNRPSLDDFTDAFLAANCDRHDRRKPHPLLLHALMKFIAHHEERVMQMMFAEMKRIDLREESELRDVLQTIPVDCEGDASRTLLDFLLTG